jgi:hypothetical protein
MFLLITWFTRATFYFSLNKFSFLFLLEPYKGTDAIIKESSKRFSAELNYSILIKTSFFFTFGHIQ